MDESKMKKVSILFLANSFADDTIQYMPEIAKDVGYDLDLYNLYIGVSPLEYITGFLLKSNIQP